ncbi:hypothetical protein B0H11DRAFT_2283037 [Mycena galericulata]|nr:hypothetical protein B0H11DRAFT_2283037 [Mycena galericulata]
MHRALSIAEIVENVCSHLGSRSLDTPGTRPDESKALSALARVCRAFEDPALDMLWFYQRSLLNILKCLPDDVWKAPLTTENHDSSVFARRIMPLDWERPMVYLNRIRALVCVDDLDLYQQLQTSLPRDLLCPNLRDLTWSPQSASAFPHIFMFLGAQIQRITIGLYGPDSQISLLPQLGIMYPGLLDVTVITPGWHRMNRPLLRQSITSFVSNLTSLKSLSLPDLGREAFDYIAQLPTLRSLVLQHPSEFTPRIRIAPNADAAQLGFTSLEYLQIDAATPEFTTALICSMKQAPVSSFITEFTPPYQPLYLRDFYSSLAAHLSHDALSCINFTNDWEDDLERDDMHIITGHILRGLFCFTNLTEVSLEPRMGFDIDDATVIEMTSAWPRIERLEFVTPAYHAQNPAARLTLNVFPAIARHCPSLSFLQIFLDTSVVPISTVAQPVQQHTLMALDVGHSSISDPLAVASFLSALFLELTTICTDHDGDRYPEIPREILQLSDVSHEKWKEVERSLPSNGR